MHPFSALVKCEVPEEEDRDWVLRQPTLELGQEVPDPELEEELRGAPEEMLLEAEFEQEEEIPEEDEIPATQPDSPLFTPLKDAAAAKDPPPSAEAVEKELKVAEASLAVNAMDAVDVRKKQLTMRAAEREKKDAENAEKAAAKKQAKKPKAKAKGRPRKLDATPPVGDAEPAERPFKRLRRKTSEIEATSPPLAKADPPAKKGKAAVEKPKKDKGKAAVEKKQEIGGKANADGKNKKKDKKEVAAEPLAETKARMKRPAAAGSADGHAAGKKAKMSDGAAGSSKKRGNKSTGEGTEPDKELQKEMMSVIEKFVNKEYDKKGESMHHGKYGDDVVYWSRGTVGIKLHLAAGWAQRYYYAFKEASIALNIFVASRVCAKIQEHGVEWHRSAEALQFDKVIRATAVAAIAAFKDAATEC
eukprot:symbB.v1.2.002899.t1/scaffold156.1/size293155/11